MRIKLEIDSEEVNEILKGYFKITDEDEFIVKIT